MADHKPIVPRVLHRMFQQCQIGNIQSTLGSIQSTLGHIQSTLENLQPTSGNIQSTGKVMEGLVSYTQNGGGAMADHKPIVPRVLHRPAHRKSKHLPQVREHNRLPNSGVDKFR